MGQVSSVLDPDSRSYAPANYTVPPFPSLYSPKFSNVFNNRGYFLYDAEAIWKFTFYWTLIMFGAAFLLCSLLAAFNLILSLSRRPARAPAAYASALSPALSPAPPLSPAPGARARSASGQPVDPRAPFHHPGARAPAPPHRRRPPLWLVALIPLAMCALATLVALVSGTVVGFALAAIYSAGSFSMSTWVLAAAPRRECRASRLAQRT